MILSEDDDDSQQLPNAQGVQHSCVFTGLRLPVVPLMAGETGKILATLTGPEPLNTKPPETSGKSEDPGSQFCCVVCEQKETAVSAKGDSL